MPVGKTRVRVISYDGLTDIPDLPHTSARWSRWIQPQGANQQSTQMGSATIGLYPSSSSAHGGASYDYSRIAKGQRVEIYEDSWQGGNVPKFAGPIKRLTQNRTTFTLEVDDALQIAANSIRLVPFSTSETADVIIRKYGVNYYKPLYLDTLAGAPTGYTTNQAWTASAFEGVSGVQTSVTTGADSLMVTPYTYDTTPLTTGAIILYDFTIQTALESGSPIPNFNSFWLNRRSDGLAGVRVDLSYAPPIAAGQVSSGTAQLNWDPTNGADALVAVFPWPAIATASGLVLRGQIAIDLKPAVGGFVPFEVLLNGQSVGLVDSGTLLPVANLATTSRAFGFRGYNYNPVTPIYFFANVSVLVSAPLFKIGTIGTPKVTLSPPQHDFNNHSNLDIIKAAATQEGWTIYMTYGSGFGNDTLSVY